MNIVTIYSNQRKDTTGVYVDKALSNLGHDFTHIDPLETNMIPLADLVILVDDGLDYKIKRKIQNMVFWAIDTHLTLDQCKGKAFGAEKVYCAQKQGEALLGAEWLPLGVDTDVFCQSPSIQKKYDIGFVGYCHNKTHDRRINYLDALFKKFPNFYFSQGTFFKDCSNKFNESRIVFNCSVNGDINMRVFEAMATGSLILTDDIPELKELGLIDGVHLATYKDETEMLDKAGYYLHHPEAREEVALCGYKEIINNHTYDVRVKKILSQVKSNSFVEAIA